MADNIMRRFLYYDEDSVNSFLAQIERGLITQNRNEGEESETSSTNKCLSDSLTGDISAKVVGVGASINGNIELAYSETEVASNLVKEVQERILHDYAFDKMYDNFERNNLNDRVIILIFSYNSSLLFRLLCFRFFFAD